MVESVLRRGHETIPCVLCIVLAGSPALVIAVPEGRITAAVVTFGFDGGFRRVCVPLSS